jgi:hypothetical protein
LEELSGRFTEAFRHGRDKAEAKESVNSSRRPSLALEITIDNGATLHAILPIVSNDLPS